MNSKHIEFMEVSQFHIQGPMLLKNRTFQDERGFFTERYKKSQFQELGIQCEFVQDNFSRSAPNVLRGLHYQYDLPQAKLVTALKGRIQDVIVDIRKNSPTFGEHISVVLDGAEPTWFWIPAGFAHGFCVLGEEPADVMYKVNVPWAPKGESGILFNDQDLKIKWNISKAELSPKDQVLPSWKDYLKNPAFN